MLDIFRPVMRIEVFELLFCSSPVCKSVKPHGTGRSNVPGARQKYCRKSIDRLSEGGQWGVEVGE